MTEIQRTKNARRRFRTGSDNAQGAAQRSLFSGCCSCNFSTLIFNETQQRPKLACCRGIRKANSKA